MLDAMSWPQDPSSGNSNTAENSNTIEMSNATENSCSNEMSDTVENSSNSVTGKWTVVMPQRRGRSKTTRLRFTLIRGELGKPWEPLDKETDTARESALMLKISSFIEKFANSKFYISFLGQMQTPRFQGKFMKVLGSERAMRMVIYGIGSIESNEVSRMQISLALLIKRKFEWIGDIQVFDPIMSLTELKVIEDLGCSVLSVNEHGRRKVVEPTLFFMPHCELVMYGNLLDENWSVDLLNRFIVFGNSFRAYIESHHIHCNKTILAATSFTEEFETTTMCDESYRAFQASSWHFFAPTKEEQLLLTECGKNGDLLTQEKQQQQRRVPPRPWKPRGC